MSSGELTADGFVVSATVSPAGTAHVLYANPDGERVLGIRRPRNGTWTTPEPVDLPEGFGGIQVNARGDVLGYRVDDDALQVTVRRAGTWSPVATVAPRVRSPSVHLDDTGRVQVVWSNPDGVKARIGTADGRWGPIVRLAPPATRGAALHPVAAFNARGAAVVAWVRNVGPAVVLQVTERDAGGGWSRSRTVSGPPVPIHGSPRVALNGSGDALVGWVTGPVRTTEGRVLRVASHRIGRPDRTAPRPVPGARDVSAAEMGIDDRGRALAVWSFGGRRPVHSAVRAPDGRWTAQGALAGSACCLATPLLVTPTGTAVMATGRPGPLTESVRVWRRPPGGRWTPAPANVGEGLVHYSGDVTLAANAAGDVVAAWRRGGGHTINEVFAAAYQTPKARGAGTVELSARQLLVNQRIAQAAIRRVSALEAKLVGAPAPTAAGQPGRVTLSVRQLVINQRIARAAIHRVDVLAARIDGEPAPPAPPAEGGDRLALSAAQLLINQRIAQAAIRRVNALAERIEDLPAP